MDAAKQVNEIRECELRIESARRKLERNINFFSILFTEKEKEFLNKRHGINGIQPRTLSQLAKEMGTPTEELEEKEQWAYDKICNHVMPFFDEYVDKVC